MWPLTAGSSDDRLFRISLCRGNFFLHVLACSNISFQKTGSEVLTCLFLGIGKNFLLFFHDQLAPLSFFFFCALLPSPPDILRFDNTYSWTRGKKLFYTTEVLQSSGGAMLSRSESSQSAGEEDAVFVNQTWNSNPSEAWHRPQLSCLVVLGVFFSICLLVWILCQVVLLLKCKGNLL